MIERWTAETTPTVRVVSLPSGLPIAATGRRRRPWPNRRAALARAQVRRIDPDQADVIEEIPADEVRLDAITIGELDIEMLSSVNARALAGVRDHVRIRQDVALRGDDEARSLRLRGRGGGRIAEIGENRHDPGRPLRENLLRVETLARQRTGVRGRRCRQRRRRATPGPSRRPFSCPGRASPFPCRSPGQRRRREWPRRRLRPQEPGPASGSL